MVHAVLNVSEKFKKHALHIEINKVFLCESLIIVYDYFDAIKVFETKDRLQASHPIEKNL